MSTTQKMTSLSIAAALAGAVSMASFATPAAAATPVKCYGIALAGENDCENAAGTHSCAGQSTVDYDGGEWQLVSDGAEACIELGGAIEPFDGIGPLTQEG